MWYSLLFAICRLDKCCCLAWIPHRVLSSRLCRSIFSPKRLILFPGFFGNLLKLTRQQIIWAANGKRLVWCNQINEPFVRLKLERRWCFSTTGLILIELCIFAGDSETTVNQRGWKRPTITPTAYQFGTPWSPQPKRGVLLHWQW